MTLLSSIHTPRDLKALTLVELEELAAEMRQTIIDVMAVNGGHLGSNLGTVEMMVALHRVFNSPEDKFIFDVSHQSYPHKLLTGRAAKFAQIRRYKGLCGFSCPAESPHDHFYAGHAGTAISSALGLAKNRDLSGRSEYVLPIIGDATLSCGMALEALNNLPKALKRFILVLNDNRMSISYNVGAIAQILSSGTFSKPAATFFEQFNLKYVGPIDGHDIMKMIEALEDCKDSTRPILLHLITVKGKGMESATQNPISWHGCKPFDKVTGKMLEGGSNKPTFPKIFGRHLLKMAENDPSLVAITPATPYGSCLTEMMQKFPDRCFDVGIAEEHAVTFSGGLAYGKKMKVVCAIYATFFQRALDNLFQDVCLPGFPVVFTLDRGGLSAEDGSTHHGIYDISFLNTMPNMVICQPRDGHLLKELLESAFSWGRPTAIRYPNMATEERDAPIERRELGKGEILTHGSDIALIALGHMTRTAFAVRDLLAEAGISASVIDPIFLKPLDAELFYEVFTSHKCAVTIEEHSVSGGLGMIMNSFVVRNGFRIPLFNFGIPDAFVEQGTYPELINEIGLDAASIARTLIKQYNMELAPIL